ncbi:class I SAM-dependent methyltransferase [Vibrio aestuarianus]|uniref:class I SAM-dependent methyltransferase n=1 Tax=Vibrio aestuarianus TaxID=28171 RepID=UPI00237CB689|nr:methyltransferase domain-containing protein [Vibrio aestuarianus]MDE1351799.1 class I SAM-dependent methyltransferase [Vibrio aestuarianus]
MKLVQTSHKVGDIAHLNFKDIDILDIRRNSIPQLCQGKKVLVIGCVDMIDMISLEEYINQGKHQFHNIAKKAEYTVGLDINEDGINQLREIGYNVECCDVVNEHSDYLNKEYDYVVLSHVIEHVVDLTGFVKAIMSKVKARKFIFAVPNAYNIKHALPILLLQRERVSNDHYYTFTPITFVKLIEALGFEVLSLYLDSERKITKGKNHIFIGSLWSLIKSRVFTHSGDIILVARAVCDDK